jgi:hypothetical protein
VPRRRASLWGEGVVSEGVINNLQFAEFKRGKANLKSRDQAIVMDFEVFMIMQLM